MEQGSIFTFSRIWELISIRGKRKEREKEDKKDYLGERKKGKEKQTKNRKKTLKKPGFFQIIKKCAGFVAPLNCAFFFAGGKIIYVGWGD